MSFLTIWMFWEKIAEDEEDEEVEEDELQDILG